MNPNLVLGFALFVLLVQNGNCNSEKSLSRKELLKDTIYAEELEFDYPLETTKIVPTPLPDINSMNFVLKFDHEDYVIPLTSPDLLWKHEKFNPDWSLVLLITGWATSYNDSIINNLALHALYEAFHVRGNTNFVAVHSSSFNGTIHTWNTLATHAISINAIGDTIAESLKMLIQSYPIEKIHIITHGLGAYLGAVSTILFENKTAEQLPRTTALDPARLYYTNGTHVEYVVPQIRRSVRFSDVIQSNNRELWYDSTGHIAFYSNGKIPLPPCKSIECDYKRAWEIYAETVYPGNEEKYWGALCPIVQDRGKELCPTRYWLRDPMCFGLTIPVRAQPSRYCGCTMSDSPYGDEQWDDIGSDIIEYSSAEYLISRSKYCNASFAAKTLKPRPIPDISSMNFVLKFDHEDYVVPLTSSELLWKHGQFKPNWPLVIFATGWATSYNDSIINKLALDALYEAYHVRGNTNFVAVHSASFIDKHREWTVIHTEAIGERIAEALEALLIGSYPIEKVHLIGNGFGAHVVGSAGLWWKNKTGKVLPRITGLDQAQLCLVQKDEDLVMSMSGLVRTTAKYVDFIHSNYGTLDAIGNLNFYPYGFTSLPPCSTIECNNKRAWEFFAESVHPGQENVWGSPCYSMKRNSTICPTVDRQPMGFSLTNETGYYCLCSSNDSLNISN